MNILIIGDGFIGKSLFKHFSKKYMTHMSSRRHMDLLHEDSIRNFFYKKPYSHVIVASGIKNIKLCEEDPETCTRVNAACVEDISKYCSGKIIYISTDYVFDGKRGQYTTKDEPNPTTVYGVSKLEGERLTLKNPKNLVVRTSGVYGEGCAWYDNLLTNTEELFAFEDVYNSATNIKDLSENLELCMLRDYDGIVHLCGERTNRYDLYKSLCRNKDLIKRGSNSGIFPKDISLLSSLL